MSSVKNGRVDDAFIDAFYQEVRACERTWQVDVSCEILFTDRRGVMTFHLTARDQSLGKQFGMPIAAYTVGFPGPTARTMAATLYQGACKLDLLVQGYRAQQEERTEAVRG